MSEDKNLSEEEARIDFSTFLYSLGTAALMNLGVIENPSTKELETNLAEAKQSIDLIELIEIKTKGNLTDMEASILKAILHELRTKYVDAHDKQKIKL